MKHLLVLNNNNYNIIKKLITNYYNNKLLAFISCDYYIEGEDEEIEDLRKLVEYVEKKGGLKNGIKSNQ